MQIAQRRKSDSRMESLQTDPLYNLWIRNLSNRMFAYHSQKQLWLDFLQSDLCCKGIMMKNQFLRKKSNGSYYFCLFAVLCFGLACFFLHETPSHFIGAAFCHQIPARSPSVGFPFCFRCSGLFFGIFWGNLLYFLRTGEKLFQPAEVILSSDLFFSLQASLCLQLIFWIHQNFRSFLFTLKQLLCDFCLHGRLDLWYLNL